MLNVAYFAYRTVLERYNIAYYITIEASCYISFQKLNNFMFYTYFRRRKVRKKPTPFIANLFWYEKAKEQF